MLRASNDPALAASSGPSARDRAAPDEDGPEGHGVGRLLEPLCDEEVLDRYFAAEDAAERGPCVQELFRRHYPKVVSWCLRFAGNRDEAYDLAQAIFAKAHLKLDAFRRDSRFTTWLYAITRRECLNSLRAQRVSPGPVEAELEDLVDEDGPGPHEAFERAASARWVRALLDRVLDEREKQVFTLHYGDDVPLDAITRLLGLSNRSGAKAFIVSARRKLQRALDEAAPDRALDA